MKANCCSNYACHYHTNPITNTHNKQLSICKKTLFFNITTSRQKHNYSHPLHIKLWTGPWLFVQSQVQFNCNIIYIVNQQKTDSYAKLQSYPKFNFIQDVLLRCFHSDRYPGSRFQCGDTHPTYRLYLHRNLSWPLLGRSHPLHHEDTSRIPRTYDLMPCMSRESSYNLSCS